MIGGQLALQFAHEPAGDGLEFARGLACIRPGPRMPPTALRLQQLGHRARIRLALGTIMACSFASVGNVIAFDCAVVSITTSFSFAWSPCSATETASNFSAPSGRFDSGSAPVHSVHPTETRARRKRTENRD
jgi:hypothetical protein